MFVVHVILKRATSLFLLWAMVRWRGNITLQWFAVNFDSSVFFVWCLDLFYHCYWSISLFLEETPLAPKDLQVNVTRKGYLFTWKNFFSPGRPSPIYFVIEVIDVNRSWTAIQISKSLNQYFLPLRNFSSNFYTFKMYAMGSRKSDIIEPKVHALGKFIPNFNSSLFTQLAS